jgi:hypothetical protein
MPRKLLLRLVILLLANAIGIRLMAHGRVMESLLGGDSYGAVAAALGFLLARFALVFLGPGMLLLAVWRWRAPGHGSPRPGTAGG